jgi:hypothetical protein
MSNRTKKHEGNTGITDEQNRHDQLESGVPDTTHPNGTQTPEDREKAKAARRDKSAQRFRKLAINRVPRALKLLAMVQNLSNKSVYYYEKEQADKIVSTIEVAFNSLKQSFNGVKAQQETFTI